MESLKTLEAGNSTLKLGEFNRSGVLQRALVFPRENMEGLISAEISPGDVVAFSSTLDTETVQQLIGRLEQAGARVYHFRTGGTWPVEIRYRTPETLGSDRILHALAAGWIAAGRPAIIVSCGTALVVDAVDAAGVFLGGAISPGLEMRFRALNAFTGRLPHVQDLPVEIPDLGLDTRSSIVSGVVHGIADEINARILRYRAMLSPESVVFLTGGDASRLANHLRNINFADPHLIHRGLFRAVQLKDFP